MSYIGNEPIVSATRTVTEVSATAGQTVFYPNGGYTVGKIDVIVNGAQLQSSDFTATNGSSVTLTTACSVGDDVKLVAWGTFTTANIPSGSLTSGAPTWSPTGGVSLPRIDSSTEGGQLNFNRASDDTGNWSIDSYGSGSTPSLRFIDGANVRATIDGSGKVGIGTSSPASKLQVSGSDSTNLAVNGSTKGVRFDFDSAQTSIVGVDNTFFGSYQPLFIGGSYLAFGNGITERMRIDSSGNLLVNTTTNANNATLNVNARNYWAVQIQTLNSSAGILMGNASGTAGYNALVFYNNGFSSPTGTIAVSGSSTAYNTSSDYRLKENISPMQNALDVVAQLKPVTYKWKSDGSNGQGFIAHELQEVVPDCVTGEKDAVDAEGKPVYQGIDTSFLVATLTAAIQELKATVDAQALEIKALKEGTL